ncbi:hypothetical protein [Actinomadura chibensis]|uniref:Nucleotide exchange factor GrpE n=1 Tax=Actinomadura chibensis TaxID=392828 RepID=A0A5D0NIT7_9ACTN|nr:hypothetical protein [Actinomadura chibensis]TYB44259.1 hypothetical protein FXF69_25285 [Actinomadura chibensis]
MGRVAARAGAALRQWRHPREFRIEPSAWSADALAALARAAVAEPAATSAPAPGGGFPEDELADVATCVWRLRARVARMDDPPRAVVHHVETAWDALADGGVEIKDHAGEPFDPGLAMSVAAYQPTPGLVREQVIETVRPGVYLGSRSIQLAEVIVGTPGTPAEAMRETRTR